MPPDEPDTSEESRDEPAKSSEVDDAIANAQSSLEEVKTVVQQASTVAPGEESGSATAPWAGDGGGADSGIDLLGDVDLHVMIELGRTQMLVEDVLKLNQGSVVELDKLAGDPVDVYVNQRLIARGEVLVLNDNFCVRISEIVADLEQEAEAAAQEQIETG